MSDRPKISGYRDRQALSAALLCTRRALQKAQAAMAKYPAERELLDISFEVVQAQSTLQDMEISG